MAVIENLGRYVPSSCEDLVTHSGTELRSAIPELARDDKRMGEVENAVQDIPTNHEVFHADATERLQEFDKGSAQLVVTSPPYFNIKEYNGGGSSRQLGDIEEYDTFHGFLDSVWSECYRILEPGGRLCVVVGDVLRSRSEHGRHRVIPLHATIQEHAREIGFDNLAPILWYKIGNASLESGGNARFLGKPYEPGAVIKNDVEYILLFRKPGGYRSPSVEERILSTIEADEHQKMFRQLWEDINGEPQTDHPAPYPVELAERLTRMFSFVGDTVLDPFAGTGSTAVAASRWGRDSISVELEEDYVDVAEDRLTDEKATLSNYEGLSLNVFR